MQGSVVGHVLGQIPGFILVHIRVDLVGQQHDLARGLAELAGLIHLGNRITRTTYVGQQGGTGGAKVASQLAIKPLGQKASRTAGDVDVFANQIAIHPGHEVIRIEVNILIACRQLGGQVITQPLGVHAEIQVLQRA